MIADPPRIKHRRDPQTSENAISRTGGFQPSSPSTSAPTSRSGSASTSTLMSESASTSTNPSQASQSPLPVAEVAGLVAAGFALFVLGTWLAVILIRRKRRRNRRTGGVGRRQRDRVPDEEAEQKSRTSNVQETSRVRPQKSEEQIKGPFVRVESMGDESAFDHKMRFENSASRPNPSHAPTEPQSIFLPSLAPSTPFPHQASPHSGQSSSWASPPSSTSPLYTSPLHSTKPFSTSSPLRHTPSQSGNSGGAQQKPPHRTRTPSQLSKSFSIVDQDELADMPELPHDSGLSKSKSNPNRPRKLEKRRRSASLRRGNNRSDEPILSEVGNYEKEKEREGEKDELEDRPDMRLHHVASFVQPLSDSDQSTKTIVPRGKPRGQHPSQPSENSPTSFNMESRPLIRQRSGIRQPGDANHLRPPKESPPTSNGNASAFVDPPSSSILPTSRGPNQPTQPSPLVRQWQGQQPLNSMMNNAQPGQAGENEVLAFHKAAGNVPKPFKPFAFQFPIRSPAMSMSMSNAGPSRAMTLSNNSEASPGNNAHLAALIAAAGLASNNSPSPSPVAGNVTPGSVNWATRGSTDGLSATPWRPSTDGLTAFPPRRSTDGLAAFPSGPRESRHSLQSGYSLEVPWETQEVQSSSPSAFSFSTDFYGYGHNAGAASTSNSIDLYRRVDPSTFFPTGTSGTNGANGIDLEGRHSLSLLGGEPLSPAELESRGLRMRRLREGHASVSSFTAFNAASTSNAPPGEDGPSTRAPSWTLETLREALFGPSHRKGQDSVASSSVGSQSRRSSLHPWTVGLGLGGGVGPPALASPRDANFQFAVGAVGMAGATIGPNGLPHPITPWNQQNGSPSSSPSNTNNPYGLAFDSLNLNMNMTANGNANVNVSASAPGDTKMKTVVRAFPPLLPDELVLRPGEEVFVLQEFDDGWCVVAREGLGLGGPPTPPGLLEGEDGVNSLNNSNSNINNGSNTQGQARVLEMGTCPLWVFEEDNTEFSRPMRSTSLGVTVSMRLPPAPPVPVPVAVHRPGSAPNPSANSNVNVNANIGSGVGGSPASTHLPLGHGHGHGHTESGKVHWPISTPLRDEVISWSNF